MERFPIAVRVAIGGLLVIAVLGNSAFGANSSSTTIITTYNTSTNTVERRMALNSLRDFIPQNGEESPLWIRDLLGRALTDESPVVVAAAVYQIGTFQLSALSTRLIALYTEVEKSYSSAYARRIQYSIIPALGKLGGKEASVFLSGLLAKDMGTSMGEYLLWAIKELGDNSLVGVVKEYKVKMEGMVSFAKGKNYDPLIYSRKLMYVNLALDVEKLLSKGGK